MLKSFSRRLRPLLVAAVLLCILSSHARADTTPPTPEPSVAETRISPTAPTQLWLPSERPSGNPINDRIWLTFYPAMAGAATPAPAVVLLHYLGASSNKEMHSFARYLSRRGIAAAVLTLPYHVRRASPGDRPINHFVAPDAKVVVQAFEQSVSDVSTVVSWLSQQNGIDPQRIGAVGVSLGAIVTHLVMGRDKRVNAGVAMLGGGDLLDIYHHSVIPKLFVKERAKNVTAQDEALVRGVDPITDAGLNQPRRVLMIQGARDLFVPPRSAEKLWKALGKPPIQWLDINHLGLQLAQKSAMKTTEAFLRQAWAGQPLESIKVPTIRVPTIKAGVLMGLDSAVTPAVQYQAFKLGKRRDHLPLLSANMGMSGRGPFIGLAATVNSSADVGLGQRLDRAKFRPYVSMHMVF
jgi:dienelactone hydrolase